MSSQDGIAKKKRAMGQRESANGRRNDRNFPCQILKIRNVSLVVMGS
jgi:hypothetical protein